MARKSRKAMPAVSGAAIEKTVEEVVDVKPYQVGIYARLSHESEANRERDTVETQIAYIRNFVSEQTDMVVADVYADISVTGTTFERPEFERMIQDIRQGKINTVITRDLSRLGRNYVEMGNYIERVFPFLDVRYIAITDDFDTARPGTDLSVPLKNIVNEYYSKDLSKKVSTGKKAIWLRGEFCDFLVPYGYQRENKRLVVDEDVRENVVRIFQMFLDGKGYAAIAKIMESEGHLSPQKYRYMKAGSPEQMEKARKWDPMHVKRILGSEYYIGNSVHGKQRRGLDTGRKNIYTDESQWVRIENTHEAIIDKEIFDKVQEEMEKRMIKHKKMFMPQTEKNPIPPNLFRRKIFCAECGGSMGKKRWGPDHPRNFYHCIQRSKDIECCGNAKKIDYDTLMDTVFEVIHKHIQICVEKHDLIRSLNRRKENCLQYDVYGKEVRRLTNETRRFAAKKSGLYEDYREGLITAEELCQYQKEYEDQIRQLETRTDEMLRRQSLYAKDFHIDEDWEKIVGQYLRKRKLSQEMVDVFVEHVITDRNGNIEVRLKYDDFMQQLVETAERLEAEDGNDSNVSQTIG